MLSLEDGKYQITCENGVLSFLRHGEPWPAADDLKHSGVVLDLFHQANQLKGAIAVIERQLMVHERRDAAMATLLAGQMVDAATEDLDSGDAEKIAYWRSQ